MRRALCNIGPRWVLLLIAALLASCSNLESVRSTNCGASVSRCTGVTYFLPYRQIQLEIERGPLARLQRDDRGSSSSGDDEGEESEDGEDEFFLSAREASACFDRVRLLLLPAIPDLTHQYTAQLRHWVVRSDRITVGISNRGLLHSLPESEDEDAAEESVEPELMVLEYFPVSGEDCSTAQFEAIFDPKNIDNIGLPDRFSQYQFSLYGAVGADSLKASAIVERDSVEGLVYRRSLPYVLTLDVCELGACYARKAVRFMLPNEGPTAVLPYRSSALVDTKYIARFRDGELIGWEVDRPAEIIAIVEIPLDLIQTAISIPARLIGSINGNQ